MDIANHIPETTYIRMRVGAYLHSLDSMQLFQSVKYIVHTRKICYRIARSDVQDTKHYRNVGTLACYKQNPDALKFKKKARVY